MARSFAAIMAVLDPIIDTCNYYPLRDGLIDGIGAGMAESEWTPLYSGVPSSLPSTTSCRTA
jgi:hypothetical protein